MNGVENPRKTKKHTTTLQNNHTGGCGSKEREQRWEIRREVESHTGGCGRKEEWPERLEKIDKRREEEMI